ncbi:MAG TPA: polymer-forming cytoskeletal protein [Saprospiraceae bacterium]|nr:polymer-forming cytoskeletal protein [Saprospiraceae bacterium]
MFGNKKDEKVPAVSAPINSGSMSGGAINSLVAETKVEGKLFAASDIRIDGELVGTLQCKGRVIIGPGGKVEGDIHCQNAVIEGTFNGVIEVVEVLNVRETAKIEGDVNTGKLVVQPGAIFNVSCNMGGQKVKSFVEKISQNQTEKKPVLSSAK